LNLCDYWLWKAVNTKMRATEKPWADGKKETRDAYLRRLKRSAQSLTKEEINHAAGSMKRRCLDLVAAKGGQIEG
jgi:IS1 family transposase